MLSAIRSSESDEYFHTWLLDIERDSPELISNYSESVYYNEDDLLRLHNQFLVYIVDQLESLNSYPTFINDIQIRADQMLSYSIFNEQVNFSYRNIIKTPKDFEHLNNIPLQLGLDIGIVSSTSNQFSDIFVTITLFIFCMFIFNVEKENGQLAFLRTTLNGRYVLFRAKLGVLLIVAVLTGLLFYGSNLILANQLFGFGDMTRFIQTIEEFRSANILLSIEQYLSIYVLGKIVSSILLAILFSLVFIVYNHPSKAYISIGALLAASYMMYHFIHPSSYMNLLKYINIVAFMDTFHLLSNYNNLNIFGYPINRIHIVTITIILACIGMVGYSAYYYVTNKIIRSNSPLAIPSKVMQAYNKVFNNRGSNRIWIHEWYKLFVSSKGYIIIVLALFITVQDLHVPSQYVDQDKIYYNDYMKGLSGKLTEEKIKFVTEEHERFEQSPNIANQLYVSYRDGDIDLDEYNKRLGDIVQFQLQRKAFDKIYDQYEYLLELKKIRNIDGHFINELSSQYLLENENRDKMNALIYIILLLLLLSSMYTYEYRNNTLRFIRTMYRGKRALFLTKYRIAFLLTILLMLLIYTPQYINTVRYYPLITWDAPIQSIHYFEAVNLSLTIFQFVLLACVLQLLGGLALTVIIIVISQLLQRLFATILAGIVLLVGPLLAHIFGYEMVTPFSTHYTQLLFWVFAKNASAISVFITYLIGFTIVGCLLYISYALHNKGFISIKGFNHLSNKSEVNA